MSSMWMPHEMHCQYFNNGWESGSGIKYGHTEGFNCSDSQVRAETFYWISTRLPQTCVPINTILSKDRCLNYKKSLSSSHIELSSMPWLNNCMLPIFFADSVPKPVTLITSMLACTPDEPAMREFSNWEPTSLPRKSKRAFVIAPPCNKASGDACRLDNSTSETCTYPMHVLSVRSCLLFHWPPHLQLNVTSNSKWCKDDKSNCLQTNYGLQRKTRCSWPIVHQ